MTTTIMVHIVDDDEAIRDSLRLLLKTRNIAAQTYGSAEEFLQEVDFSSTACIVADVRMPGMSGLELQKTLIEKNCHIPLIIITGHGDVDMAVQAMKAGACDFLEKPIDSNKLLSRINECLHEEYKHHDEKKILEQAHKLLSHLTERENQVMNELVKGKLNKVIAAELGISVRTVEAHRAKIMEKLEAHSLSDIVRIAITAS